jgi:tetratricopeptide (TPR) repeat protein
MVTHVASGHPLPKAVVRGISERSEGVPLFVEEVTRAVLESGALRLNGNSYELFGSFEERFLPSTVEGSLVARFDRLGQSRGVAQLGAAIGREFSYALLRAVARMGEEELRGHLIRLVQSELVWVRGEPPTSSYSFKHALIQEAIYGTLLKTESARVHARILAALQDDFPEVLAERPETAAYHAERAGQREAAVPLLLRAGAKALTRTAVAEAVKHLAQGIELVGVLEESVRTAVEIELQAAIGPAYMATVGWAAPEVERSSTRLLEMAAAAGDGPRLFQAQWSLWTVRFLRGELVAALEVAREVLKSAEAAGASLLRVTGHHAVGYTHFYRGEYAEALRHAHAGLDLFDLEQERAIAQQFQFSSSCALLCYQAQALQVMGKPEDADESFRRWRKLVDDLRHPPSRAYSLVQQCHFCFARGDAALLSELATEGLSLAEAEGFVFWLPILNMFLAWASVRQGADGKAAAEEFRRAKARVDDSLIHVTELDFTSMFAETLLAADQPQEVFRVAEAALAITRPGEVRHMEPELLRLQGDAANALGDRRRAEDLHREALGIARGMGASMLESRAAAALGLIANRS